MILSLSSLALAIGFYSVSQLLNHGKLKWESKQPWGFWGQTSAIRKYKVGTNKILPAPNNWYYRFFKIKYKERFPLSTTFLVSLTDGYHLMQSLSFLSLSACISLLSDISFWYVWLGVLAVHFLTYRLLSR